MFAVPQLSVAVAFSIWNCEELIPQFTWKDCGPGQVITGFWLSAGMNINTQYVTFYFIQILNALYNKTKTDNKKNTLKCLDIKRHNHEGMRSKGHHRFFLIVNGLYLGFMGKKTVYNFYSLEIGNFSTKY